MPLGLLLIIIGIIIALLIHWTLGLALVLIGLVVLLSDHYGWARRT